MTLEILDTRGATVRKYSTNDQQRALDESQSFPTYWLRPPFPLSKKIGLNRFVWDLRYERPQATRYGYTIGAAYGEDAILVPEGPLVSPGTYQVKLTVAGRSYTAPIEVKMDPRVKIAPLALNQQVALEKEIVAAMNQSFAAVQQLTELRAQLKALLNAGTADAAITEAAGAFDKKVAELLAVETQYPPVGIVSVAALNGSLGSLLLLVEGADTAPTAQASETFATYKRLLDQQLVKWEQLKGKDLAALNELLRQRQLPPIKTSE